MRLTDGTGRWLSGTGKVIHAVRAALVGTLLLLPCVRCEAASYAVTEERRLELKYVDVSFFCIERKHTVINLLCE